ncbi:hypothetical protein HMPREF1980_00158 [Actinomyces sp. oral taxon 172 str. F0311]|nr:hypothetical protein HMPREF1980_00158 [Actinomyces sp. oral taxon 172 str. F0311]
MISMFEIVPGELHATLLGNHESLGHKRPGLLSTTQNNSPTTDGLKNSAPSNGLTTTLPG